MSNIILKDMVFQNTKNINPNNCKLYCQYTCVDEQCDFSACLNSLNLNTNPSGFVSREIPTGFLKECVKIIEIIDSHQNEFLPSRLDGFVIDKCILKRKGSYGDGITGVVGRQAGFLNLDNEEQKKEAIRYIVVESIKKQNCVVS